MTLNNIPDVQGSADKRHLAINRVGIRDIKIPLEISTKSGKQHTVATVEMTVALPHEQKGTHMSRFINMLNDLNTLSIDALPDLHKQMLEFLSASEGSIHFEFPLFVKKTAPMSKVESFLDYKTIWFTDGSVNELKVWQEVTVPVTSLCPCSKEISKYSAHNQRSHIIIKALYNAQNPVLAEELIHYAEEEGSCEIWSTLKRVDEKYVTERAYENPKFVEDIVRDVAIRLNADSRITAYRVSSENFESIHNHSAYAIIERA